MSTSAIPLFPPTGLGSLSGAPNLPAGFSATFTDQYIDTGEVRLHAVIGGDGPPLLLVHGWPETWYAWRLLMPALAQKFRVVAVDQRGIGLSEVTTDGYDSGTQGNDLVALMDKLGYERFAVVGHDTGMPISYALAADHPERVERLAVAEGPPPGIGQGPAMWNPAPINDRTFHLMFNHLPTMNDQLIRGRENIYLGFEFGIQAGTNKLPIAAVMYYTDILRSRDDALQGSLGWYRALDTTIAQDQQRALGKLTMPVLGMGGAQSLGAVPGEVMSALADNVQIAVIPCGHWIMEEAPNETLAVLTAFLAP
jgi:pimeloyl-ACP methyl ester carboxylesterase